MILLKHALSIGYRVSKWAETVDPTTRERTRTATAWELIEASLVPIPADPAAIIRSQTLEPTEIENTPDAAILETRQAIRAIQRSAGLTAEWADSQIDAGADVTAARSAAFEEMMKRQPHQIRTATVGTSSEDPAVIRTRQVDALVHRMAGGDLPEASRQFGDWGFYELARDALTRSGVAGVNMLGREETLRRAMMTTSDFPLVVSNAVGKVAMESYRAAESPLKVLYRKRTLRDFKESTAIRLGELGRLLEMTEHGEFKHTTRAEHGETMRLKTYGRALDVSRTLLVNDDLNLLGDITAAFGEAAAQTEADLLVDLLTGNPAMSDGLGVFHATRDNVGTAGAITVAALSEARQAMRLRTGIDGKTIINAAPKYIVVGADRETEAEQVLAELAAGTIADVNPFGGKLQLIVEPRITDDSWFVFADPARLPATQYAYLAGGEGVQVQRADHWDVLGMKFRAWLDFGAGWIDWRGAYRNAGA